MGFFTKKKTIREYGGEYESTVLNTKKIAICIALLVIVLLTVLNSFTIIPSGYTGVRTTFGQIDESVISNGLCFKLPYIQGVKTVNNKQQEASFGDQVWGESSERTVVYMADITITYRINPEYSAWLYENVNSYKQNALPQTLVASALKSSMVTLSSNEVTNRTKIEPLAVNNLQAALDKKYDGKQVISIINISIKDMDFEESYNKAIADKQIAQMSYEQQVIQNQKAIDTAAAEAEQKRIKAEAEAKKKVIGAEAEANAITAIATAQAEANEKLSQSITGDLIEYEKAQKWDGRVSTVSGGTSIISMDIGEK